MTSHAPVYAPWHITRYYGATRQMPAIHLRATGRCEWPADDRRRLLAVSLTIAGQLASARPELRLLAGLKPDLSLSEQPVIAWLTALFDRLNLPEYPLRSESDRQGLVKLYLGSPYLDASDTGIKIATALLTLASLHLSDSRPPANIGPLIELLARLPRQLPSPLVMDLHAEMSRQGIDWEWLTGDLYRAGQGRQQRLYQGVCDSTGSAALEAVIRDAALTDRLMRAAGLAVRPTYRCRNRLTDLLQAAQTLGYPLRIRSAASSHEPEIEHLVGNPAALEQAHQSMAVRGPGSLLLQTERPARRFDILVINGQIAAVAEYPAGQARGSAQEGAGTAGTGRPRIVSESLHPRLIECSQRIHRLFPLAVLTLTYTGSSVTEPPDDGWFGDINPRPDLQAFKTDPALYGALVPALVRTLCPVEPLRIPVYTVTGSIGKTTTVRLLDQLLKSSGKTIGLTASDGAWVGDQKWLEGDCIGGRSASAMLRRPDVEVAILETGRGGIIKQGIAFRRSSVAVLLNVLPVHLETDGISSLVEMADVKALTLAPADRVVLNHDDPQCSRIGESIPADKRIWFSVSAASSRLQALTRSAQGSAGIRRGSMGEPMALEIWQAGKQVQQFSLRDVAPFQGLLTEKTLEELLAAVAAAWFGPVKLPNWSTALPQLQLDRNNHAFRCSLHRAGSIFFVLDKAGEPASLHELRDMLDTLCQQERITRRIGVVTRAAAVPPAQHLASCACLYDFLDEFVCFDRPDTYQTPAALPDYRPGSIPALMAGELERLNIAHGTNKPIDCVADWAAAEQLLRSRLAPDDAPTLVLINQPSTNVAVLNRSIIDFVNRFGSTEPQTT